LWGLSHALDQTYVGKCAGGQPSKSEGSTEWFESQKVYLKTSSSDHLGSHASVQGTIHKTKGLTGMAKGGRALSFQVWFRKSEVEDKQSSIGALYNQLPGAQVQKRPSVWSRNLQINVCSSFVGKCSSSYEDERSKRTAYGKTPDTSHLSPCNKETGMSDSCRNP